MQRFTLARYRWRSRRLNVVRPTSWPIRVAASLPADLARRLSTVTQPGDTRYRLTG